MSALNQSSSRSNDVCMLGIHWQQTINRWPFLIWVSWLPWKECRYGSNWVREEVKWEAVNLTDTTNMLSTLLLCKSVDASWFDSSESTGGLWSDSGPSFSFFAAFLLRLIVSLAIEISKPKLLSFAGWQGVDRSSFAGWQGVCSLQGKATTATACSNQQTNSSPLN